MLRLKLGSSDKMLAEQQHLRPHRKVTRAGFNGETNNLAGRQGMCTRRIKQTQNSAGRDKDQTEMGETGRGMGVGRGGRILARTRMGPNVQEAGKGSFWHRKPE